MVIIMPNEKCDKMLNELMLLLSDEDKLICQQVAGFLMDLGYVPQKQKVQANVLSFRLNKTNKVIAKIGIPNGINQRAFFSIKFLRVKVFLKNILMHFNTKLIHITGNIADLYDPTMEKTDVDIAVHAPEVG